MTQSDQDRRVDYIEFGATDLSRTKEFYEQAFGWRFQDYGPDYTSFQDGRLSGGFTKDAPVQPANPLVVIYAVQLEAIEAKIKQAGGRSSERPTRSRAAADSTSPIPAGTSWRCGPIGSRSDTAPPLPSYGSHPFHSTQPAMAKPLLQLAALGVGGFALWKIASLVLLPFVMLLFKAVLV